VADLLLGQGRPVRVLEHRRSLEELGRRGAEILAGDLADVGPVGVLLKDATAVLVLLPDVVTDPEFMATRSRMNRVISDALEASSVDQVVVLSTTAAGHPGARPSRGALRPVPAGRGERRAARRRQVGGGGLGGGRDAARRQRPAAVRRPAARRRPHGAHPAGGVPRRGDGRNGLQRLRGRFRGALLRPDEEGYDEARRVWNGAIDRRPAPSTRCAGADDVAAAVRFAASATCPCRSAAAATPSPVTPSSTAAS
jgi:hypothetical protein